MRSSEIFWLATAFGVWSAYCYKQIIWRYLPWLILGLILGIAPVLVVNYLILRTIIYRGLQWRNNFTHGRW